MTRPLRVLHLEDSARDAELVRHRLEGDGVSCDIHLANGKASFEAALARESFDLIISDYNLPGYDGITALRQVQSTQPDVPVILVSGTVSEEQAVKCLQIGATDYLLKDRLDRLAPAVQRAIQEADTRLTRKRAEVALAQSERRKAAILDSVLDCIVTMDADGVVIEFNAAAERTFGYAKAEAIGRPLADLIIPPALRAAHAAGLARYLATHEGRLLGKVIEITAMRSDGSVFPIELTITAIHSEQAPIFTGVMRDITARRRADETLRTAEERMRFALESAGVGIWDLDYATGSLRWSATLEAQYGLQPGTFGGTFEAFMASIHPDDRESVLDSIAKNTQSGVEFSIQNRSIWPDGTVQWLNGAGRIHLDLDGKPVRGVGISQNVTGRKRAEDELKRLNDEILLQRLRIFQATMRTVQDIVNNLLGSFQLVRVEAEDQLPAGMLALIDQMIDEASVKLKALGNLETIQEKDMAIGPGIDYPGATA